MGNGIFMMAPKNEQCGKSYVDVYLKVLDRDVCFEVWNDFYSI